MVENILYYGDNLDVLRLHVADESVDLIYLDPPFKSEQDYNVLFAEQNGSRAAAQIKAFEDTWRWDQDSARSYQEVVETGPPRVSQVMHAFRLFLGGSDMMAYLAMMAPRLIELRRVLKSTGSIYLHCDPTASHYLKILMDAVFGPVFFRNEIIWKRTSAHSGSKRWGPVHDTILMYSKSDTYCWNPIYQKYSTDYLDQFYRFSDEKGRFRIGDLTGAGVRKGDSGKPWKNIDPTAVNRHWAVPNKIVQELIGKKKIGQLSVQEKLDILDTNGLIYWPPKGKVPQLKRYLDEDKGVAITDVAVAERLKRRWIGIDVTHLAVALMKHRLRDTFGNRVKYRVIGEPVSLPEARTLAKQNRYQFQWWALGLVGARPVEQKKGADRGIDGRLYFHDEPDNSKSKTKQIVISVKSGKVGVKDVRDLRGVVERETAQIGVLISMEKPTNAMRKEATGAGFYKSPWREHPVMQILTVEELLQGKKIDYPDVPGVNVTFKRAPKAKCKKTEHPELDYQDQ